MEAARRITGGLMFFCFALGLGAAEESSLSLVPYGYVRLDAIYETGSSSHGNYVIWAADPGRSDGLFHLTANQTRLGLRLAAGKVGPFTLGGCVEIDFYGGGAENKAFNYMRHAYLELKNDHWSIIAGQTWDIINPLNPATLNYAVMWSNGNIGYRRPQLSVHYRVQAGKTQLIFEGGIFRTIAGDLDSDGIDDGTAQGLPTLQGRVAAKVPLRGDGFVQIGISGHTGNTKGKVPYDSHSLNVDLTLTLSKRLTLLGEFYSGKDMLPFMGGIAQGVNSTSKREIESTGVYAAAQAGLTTRLKLNAGWGQDTPKRETLAPGNRSKSQTAFANLIYTLKKPFAMGLEIARVATDTLGGKSQRTLRFQHCWTLSF